MIDTLHTVDQGIASHIVGNVIWLVVVSRKKLGGTSKESLIAAVNQHLKQWYKSAGAGLHKLQGKLTIERVRTRGSWPKLKAKAAATRHLAAYALHLMSTFGRDTAEDRRALAVCQLLVKFYELLDSEGVYLSKASKAEISKLGTRICILYSGLAADAAAAGVKMWKMNPKLHLFAHLCEWQASEVGTPRCFWTYADEDLVGLLVEVAESCHPQTMAVSALFKWVHVYFE